MEDGYTRDSQGLANVSPDDPKNWPRVDALAERYGRYVVKNWQIFDYHTAAVPVPGGLFKNALAGTPAPDGPMQAPGKPTRRVQVLARCESPGQFIGVARHDLYFLEAEGSFGLNYFKGAVGLWYRLVIALAIAVTVSTYFAGVLSFLIALFLFIAGFFRDFVQELAFGNNAGGGPLESIVRLVNNTTPTGELDQTATVKAVQMGDTVFRWGIRRFMNVIPDVDRYGFTEFVAEGFSIGPGYLLLNLITLSAYVLPWLVAAYYLMRAREIAA
jgi:hypothetical protein